MEDHPRIRGTNWVQEYGLFLRMGSPPHTRDKLAKDVGVCRQTRITPAYAGQIRSLWKNVIPKRDHPRIRGTNFRIK